MPFGYFWNDTEEVYGKIVITCLRDTCLNEATEILLTDTKTIYHCESCTDFFRNFYGIKQSSFLDIV